jgi:predicted transcriptional regulator
MKMTSVYTNPRLLLMTEQNKTNICQVLKDKWLDAESLGKEIGLSTSRASVLCKHLGEEGYVEYQEEQMIKDAPNGRKRRFYRAIKDYVPKEIQLKKPAKYSRANNYYGVGEFFNPFVSKPTGGVAINHKLMETKSNDYFHRPLRKRGAISIGSTFSLYDGATL